jgi:hypothetical protein
MLQRTATRNVTQLRMVADPRPRKAVSPKSTRDATVLPFKEPTKKLNSTGRSLGPVLHLAQSQR